MLFIKEKRLWGFPVWAYAAQYLPGGTAYQRFQAQTQGREPPGYAACSSKLEARKVVLTEAAAQASGQELTEIRDQLAQWETEREPAEASRWLYSPESIAQLRALDPYVKLKGGSVVFARLAENLGPLISQYQQGRMDGRRFLKELEGKARLCLGESK